jgi:cell division initiation protein
MPTYGDLLNRRFEKVSFGGYKTADVDSFMAELSTTLSQSGRETTELKRKLEAAEKKIEKFESEEENLKNTLLNAQKLADSIVKEAQEKADIALMQAQEKAGLMTQSAQFKAENVIDCAQSEIEMRKEEASRLKREISDFKLSVMRLYKAQLELISEIPSEDPPAQPVEEKEEVQVPPQEEDILPGSSSAETNSVETIENPPKEENPAAEENIAFEEAAVTESEATAEPQVPVEEETAEEPTRPQETEEEQKPMRTVKLNLRYNEKTGEYEPISQPLDDKDKLRQDKDGDGLKFGADYNIRTDSFNGGSGRRPWRK